MNQLIIVAASCLLGVQIVAAQSAAALSSPTAPQIAAKIDEYMNAAVRVDNFSGAILAAQGGSPILSKGYGMANVELNVPNTPNTVFRLGSITKSFTAAGVMLLQERGKLKTGDSICKYLPDCPAAWQPVTIRHLLTHTSGIPNYTALPDYGKTMSLPVTHASLIERFKNLPLEFAPGEKAVYGNSGFYLLGVIIERAAGKSYEDFLQENVFTPLGMINTGYDSSRRIVKNRAAGYRVEDNLLVNAAYLEMTIPFAAGALYSTAEDLLRFDQALYSEKLLSRKSLDEMFTPFKNDYGYGWTIKKLFDRQTMQKDGGINGFSTFLSRFPADRVTVIVLSNKTGVSFTPGIANDLAAIVFGAPYQIPRVRKVIALNSRTLEKYVGQYQPASGAIISITFESGKLMRQVGEQPKAELLAESETEFYLKGNNLQTTFVADAAGRVTEMVLLRGGRDRTTAQKTK